MIPIVVAAVIVTSILFAYNQDEKMKTNSGWITGEDYCSEWCDQEELEDLGCNQKVLAYIKSATNALDEDFDGMYMHEWMGFPDGVTEELFEKCVAHILENRDQEFKDEKTVRLDENLTHQVCSIIEGDCPPYYLGNIQEDGTILVGFVKSDQEKIQHYRILIENETIIDVEVSEDGVSQKRGPVNPEKDIPIFFEIQLMEQNIEWSMPEREWNNPDFEMEPPGMICSQITLANGTDVFISTIFQSPFSVSAMTFHDTLPDDCMKTLPVSEYGRK